MDSSCKKLGYEGKRGERPLERVWESRLKTEKGTDGWRGSCGSGKRQMRAQP